MNIDWYNTCNYAYIAQTNEKLRHLDGALKQLEKKVRSIEPISKQPHLGQNLDTYA